MGIVLARMLCLRLWLALAVVLAMIAAEAEEDIASPEQDDAILVPLTSTAKSATRENTEAEAKLLRWKERLAGLSRLQESSPTAARKIEIADFAESVENAKQMIASNERIEKQGAPESPHGRAFRSSNNVKQLKAARISTQLSGARDDLKQTTTGTEKASPTLATSSPSAGNKASQKALGENDKSTTLDGDVHRTIDSAQKQLPLWARMLKSCLHKREKKKTPPGATPTPTCDSKCSPECRTEHNRGSRKYAACDLPDFSPEGMKRIMKYSYAKRQHGCATVSKRRSTYGDSHSCTSCQPGRTLFTTGALGGTGHCQILGNLTQSCTILDQNSCSANGMPNSLCTKTIKTSMGMWIKRGLIKDGKRGSAVWKHFRPAFNRWGVIRVFYVAEKYIACRDGSCATKKVVKCTKVCPLEGEVSRGGWTRVEADSRCSSKYCKEP